MVYKDKINNKLLSFTALGCWQFGETELVNEASNIKQPSSNHPGKNYWNGQRRSDSIKTIDAALRGGITYFDTAQSYGLGLSEQITGQRIRKVRDKIILATKIIPGSNSSEAILDKIKLSLRRMNTDYIDILYLHWPHSCYDIRFAVEALEKAKKIGLIKHIGVSNFSVVQMEEAAQGGNIEFCQIGYSFMWRHREKDVIPYCISKEIFVVAYSFYAQGLFFLQELFTTEDIDTKPDIPIKAKRFYSSMRKNLVFFKKENQEITAEIIKQLSALQKVSGYTIPQLLVNWGKSKPFLASILTGASTRKQIEETIEAADTEISQEILAQLEEISLVSRNITDSGNIFAHNPE